MGKIVKMSFEGKNLKELGKLTKDLFYSGKNWTLRVGLLWGNIHVYYHNIQRSSSLKRLSQSKPNFTWNILRTGEFVCLFGMKVYVQVAVT